MAEMPGEVEQRIVKIAMLTRDLEDVERQSTEARKELRVNLETLERLAGVRAELERRIAGLLAEGGPSTS